LKIKAGILPKLKGLPVIEQARGITITPYAAFEIEKAPLYQIKNKPLWIDGVHSQPHIFDFILMRLDSKVPTIITCDAPEKEIAERVGLSVLQKIKSEAHFINLWPKVAEPVEAPEHVKKPEQLPEVPEIQKSKGFLKKVKSFFMVD